MTAATVVPRPGTYAGVFFVCLTTMLYELLLTRIFSVTMWYHFAFMAVSIAMFGMTVGALVVYLRCGVGCYVAAVCAFAVAERNAARAGPA